RCCRAARPVRCATRGARRGRRRRIGTRRADQRCAARGHEAECEQEGRDELLRSRQDLVIPAGLRRSIRLRMLDWFHRHPFRVMAFPVADGFQHIGAAPDWGWTRARAFRRLAHVTQCVPGSLSVRLRQAAPIRYTVPLVQSPTYSARSGPSATATGFWSRARNVLAAVLAYPEV